MANWPTRVRVANARINERHAPKMRHEVKHWLRTYTGRFGYFVQSVAAHDFEWTTGYSVIIFRRRKDAALFRLMWS